MKARWQAISARYAALNQREKAMVAAAACVVIALGGQSLWVDPPRLRAGVLGKQIAQQKNELAQLQAQALGLQAQVKDPDAANKAAMAELRGRLAATDQSLRQLDNTLVPPQRMAQLLQSLLKRHRGLELVSLQTLPAKPLIAPPSATKGDGKADAKAEPKMPPAPPATSDNIFKHGIEVKVAGSYADLLAYVTEIEQMPQKLIFGHMALNAATYPRSELVMTVYSLSLDATWLVV